mmetsp:Transcript_9238/g.15363  ORF Transcript_9238/g.15363 Transcript_9238/m.15363 type:complete len:310 (+) Transcript_9238:41-970(+)
MSQPFERVGRLVGHDGPVQAVCFTDDTKYCLTAGHDRTVRLWNPLRLDAKSEALPMHIYADGHMHAVSAVASHDVTMVSSSNKSLVVTDMVTAKVKHRISQSHTGPINNVDVRQEAIFLSASYDGTCKLWDARNLNRQTPIQICDEAKDSVTCVQLDGPHAIYTASVDGHMRLYDIRQGRVTDCNVGAPIVSMAMADDCVVVSCLDGTMRLVDKELGELLNTYHGAHTTSQYAVACGITFRHVLTGSETGPASVLYDLVTAKVVQKLQDVESKGPTCAVAAQEKCLVTASFHSDAPLVWTNDASQVSRD